MGSNNSRDTSRRKGTPTGVAGVANSLTSPTSRTDDDVPSLTPLSTSQPHKRARLGSSDDQSGNNTYHNNNKMDGSDSPNEDVQVATGRQQSNELQERDNQLQTLQNDLAEVEAELTQQRTVLFDVTSSNVQNAQQSGRAIFDSLGSALGNIRTRLQDVLSTTTTTTSADASTLPSTTANSSSSNETLSALSQRLSTAERAHSTRMPLGLLQQQADSISSNSRTGDSTSFAPFPHSMGRSMSSGGDSSLSVAESAHSSTDGDASSDTPTQSKRRRSSTLMASRKHADVQERRNMELHEDVASTSTRSGFPDAIPEERSEEMKLIESNDDDIDKMEHLEGEEEIELLLPESTREQLKEVTTSTSNNHYAYHHLTGSLKVLSQGSNHSVNRKDGDVEFGNTTVVRDSPSKDVPTYPPLYCWGSPVFQSSSCNSPPETYELFGQSADDDGKSDESTLLSLKKPKKLPTETRLGRSNIVSMSVSSTHMAFATSTGRILICGDNRAGAVDPSQKDILSFPRPMHLELLAMNRILKVSCGSDHTAAMTETKSVLTWGSNLFGQLGRRMNHPTPNTNFARPAAMAFVGKAADVVCGNGFTLVLTTRMEVLLCGREEVSGHNALEDNEKGTLVRLPEQNTSLKGLPLVHMAAGNRHAVVLTAHGTAYAWGANELGQCGRIFPKQLHVPVPIGVPKTSRKADADGTLTTSAALVNWDVWKSGETMTLADDVNIIHAACGDDHTVLVTKTGRLLVCGSNAQGQLGMSVKDQACSTSFTEVEIVEHPKNGRKFLSVEAGSHHTIVLDDHGSVWQMGNGSCILTELSTNSSEGRISRIAAGGSMNLGIAVPNSANLNCTNLRSPSSPGLDDLMEAIRMEHEQFEKSDSTKQLPSAGDLARRIEELFRSAAVMNSFFMDPREINSMYQKLIDGGHNHDIQQTLVTAIEKGMTQCLESLRDARMMYPEAVRALLLFLQFPLLQQETDEGEKETLVFDRHGSFLVLLCETMLGLPFEGYKALMAWATTVYGKELFVPFLVRPLVFQLNKRLKKQQTYGVPMIAGVLRWLQNLSEESESRLAQNEDFHCIGIEELPMEVLFEDLTRYRSSTKADRSVNFYLAGNSFLMSPSVKRNLLQVENQLQMVQAAQSGGVSFDPTTRAFLFKPYFVLAVDRKYILQQTLQAVANASPRELRKSLKVVFKGEDGVDAGGVTKEYFQLLIQKLFDVNTGMWRTENQHEYWFNSDCTWNDDGFYLVGVLVGLALYNSVLLDIYFPHSVYRKLLGMPLGLEDLVDTDVRKGIKSLVEYEGDDVEAVFCLNFEVTWMVLGQEHKKELKPDGANIAVTSSNKEEYVMLYVKWLLVDSVESQYTEFERGFMQVMEGSSLDLLLPHELELLVVGSPELDFTALEKSAKYEGGFDGNYSVVKNLWRWVQSASRDTQLKFLKFCTGSGKAPIGGLGALPFLIQRAGPDSMQLPTAHTCFNTLILPDYGDDYDKLDRLMGRAVLECEGFGLQ